MNRIDQAFQEVNRGDFLPPDALGYANIDAPIDIGYGQTNSQPTTVRLMLEWLEVKSGGKILDVGSGSGWTTALLAHLVGPNGFVYAVENIPELVKFGADNCKKAGIKNARFFKAGPVYGLPDFAPYDRILVSAAAKEVPQTLLDQLKKGGKMVIPVQHDILVIAKRSRVEFDIKTHSGFVFVPLSKPDMH